MAEIVYELLDEYDIKEKLFCITTDNASNNLTMVKELSRKLLMHDGISWDYETRHIPCLPHIINLVVQRFLKTLVKDHHAVEDDLSFDDIDSEDILAMETAIAIADDGDAALFADILRKFALLQSPFVEVLSGGRCFNKLANRMTWSP